MIESPTQLTRVAVGTGVTGVTWGQVQLLARWYAQKKSKHLAPIAWAWAAQSVTDVFSDVNAHGPCPPLQYPNSCVVKLPLGSGVYAFRQG